MQPILSTIFDISSFKLYRGLYSPVYIGPGRNPEYRFSRDQLKLTTKKTTTTFDLCLTVCQDFFHSIINEPRLEKNGFMHMRKQRRRSAVR